MKPFFTYLLLIFLLGITTPLCAQSYKQDTLTMRFMDVEIPLSNVAVYLRNGIIITHSDSDGFIHIPAYYLQYTYLIAVHDGYEPDTIRDYEKTVYLQGLAATLQEAVIISNKPIQRILQSSRDYVVDYDFVGDNILVAAYNGAFGRGAKLFLLDNYGDTIALKQLPEEPLSIFKSCVGKYYCVCYNKFYPLDIDSGHIELGKPYDIKYLKGLKQCQVALDNKLYYKICNPDSFLVTYGFIEKGDSIFHVFLQFHDTLSYVHSREEDVWYYTEDEKRKFRPKFDVGNMRNVWDKDNLRMIDLPIFLKNDTLLVFDHTDKMIRYFNLEGIEVKNTPSDFLDKKNPYADIIKDLFTEKFYVHPINSAEVQTINEIMLNEGQLDAHRIKLKKPFAEDIKIHNGHIYFLWQDHHNAATRQLYVYTP